MGESRMNHEIDTGMDQVDRLVVFCSSYEEPPKFCISVLQRVICPSPCASHLNLAALTLWSTIRSLVQCVWTDAACRDQFTRYLQAAFHRICISRNMPHIWKASSWSPTSLLSYLLQIPVSFPWMRASITWRAVSAPRTSSLSFTQVTFLSMDRSRRLIDFRSSFQISGEWPSWTSQPRIYIIYCMPASKFSDHVP